MPAECRGARRCPGCSALFTLEDLLRSPDIRPIGMLIETNDHSLNHYYFNHTCPSCGSTFVVPILDFLPLIREVVPERIMTGSDACEGRCTRIDDLAGCSAPCRYAPFRRFLLELRSGRRATAHVEPKGPGPEA